MTSVPEPPDPEVLLQHAGWLRGLVRGLIRGEQGVEDVVHDTWVVALERPPRRAGALPAWLARVARNAAFSRRRRQIRAARRDRAAARAESVPSTDELVGRAEMHQRVVQAVLALEEPYRSTLLMRYFEDLSPQDIARRSGIPAGTVRSRLKRALDQLRRRFDRESGGGRAGWCAALLPLALPQGSSAAAFIGTLAMSMKTKIALLGILLVIAMIATIAIKTKDGEGSARKTSTSRAARTTSPTPSSGPTLDEAVDAAVDPVDGAKGLVVDDAGIALADVAVVAQTSVPSPETEPSPAGALTRTNATGHFALPGAADLLFLKEGYEIARVGAAEVEDGLRVVLRRGRTLHGVVRDSSARPIPGATVLVAVGDKRRIHATADDRGRYRFRYLPLQLGWCAARATGYRQAGCSGEELANVRDFTLIRDTLIVDVVDEETGEPIDSAGALLLRAEDREVLSGLDRMAAPPGRRSLRLAKWVMPPGLYDVFVFAPGYACRGQRVERRADAEYPHLRIPLRRGEAEPMLSGRVTGADGARVEVRARAPEISAGMADARLPLLASQNAAADGTFEFRGLPAGRYRLVATAPSAGAKGVDVDVPGHDVVVSLEPGADLEVAVVSLDGAAVAGAWIHLQSVRGERFRCEQTDAEGVAHFAGLAAGTFIATPKPDRSNARLTGIRGRISNAEIELSQGDRKRVELTVPSPVRFTFQVVDEFGNPRGGTKLQVAANGISYAHEAGFAQWPGIEVDGGVEGQAVVEMYPGVYHLTATAGNIQRTEWITVPLKRGAAAKVEIPLKGRTVRGRVLEFGSGKPISGRPIYVYDAAKQGSWIAQAATDEKGAFEAASLTQASVRVTVAPNLTPDRGQYPGNVYPGGFVFVDLQKGSVEGVTIELPAGGSLVESVEIGLVVKDAETGEPIEQASAWTRALLGHTWVTAGWARTGADGRPAEKYSVFAAERYVVEVRGPRRADPPYEMQRVEIDGTKTGVVRVDVALKRKARR